MNVISISQRMTVSVVPIPAFAYGGTDADAAEDRPLEGPSDSPCPLVLRSPHRAFTHSLWCRG
ncbi:hypothetical protein OKW32_002660 [Paraburkholderia youngii]